jgi:hypothetical protein
MNLVTSFSFRFWATWGARCFSGHGDYFLVLEFKIPDIGSVTVSCQTFLLLDQDLPSDYQDSETLGISSRSFGEFRRKEEAPSQLWGKIYIPFEFPSLFFFLVVIVGNTVMICFFAPFFQILWLFYIRSFLFPPCVILNQTESWLPFSAL